MLRRLLLLLALLLALPATARPACHDMGAARPLAMQTGEHGVTTHVHARGPDDAARPGDHAMSHDCLGCIPPDMLLGARLGSRVVPRARVIPSPLIAFAPGEALRPTPPPPKNA